MLATRNFAEAAKLLIDSLATFTSTELCSYEAIAHCAIVAGVLSLERVDLKNKIIDSPEILSIASTTPNLEPLLNLTNSLYTCSTIAFPVSLESYEKLLLPNKYLYKHANFSLEK